MAHRTCSVEGCERDATGRGYCRGHYKRWYYGRPLDAKPLPPERKCSVDGCDRSHLKKGWCSTHFSRMQARGTTEPRQPKDRRCSVDGCDQAHEGRGYCKSHRRQFKKHGDPLLYKESPTKLTSERVKKMWADPEYRAKAVERSTGKNSATYKGAKRTIMCATCWGIFTAYPNYKGPERKFCSIKCAAECPERREKVRKANTGKKASPETIKKLHDSHIGKFRGPLSPTWKGGRSLVGQKLRTSTVYREWRQAVMARDDYTCQLCGVRGGKLQADHYPYPFSKFPDKRLDVDNGRTLCRPCHHHVTYVTKEWRLAEGPDAA